MPAIKRDQTKPTFNHVPAIQMYTLDEAASISRISRSSLYEMIHDGRLPSRKIGGHRLIHDADLRRLLQIVVA